MSGEEEVRARLQFLHPEKPLALWELAHRPESDRGLLARIFGVHAAEYSEHRSSFRAAARLAAAELLADEPLDPLPFGPGDVVAALGDSITDDYQSWAEILREVVALHPSADGVRIVNHGISGDTTTDVLRRLWHVGLEQPAWLITLVGTNDARRDAATGAMLVSHEETERNLGLIGAWARSTGVRHVVWMTPPPVHEERIAAFARAAGRGVAWRNADLSEKAERVLRQPGLAVDVRAAFGSSRSDELLLPDGLHPSLAGQKLIAARLVAALARTAPD